MTKTVLITGASRGIGQETARIFAANNYRVIINYFKSESCAKTLEKELLNAGCDCITAKADVSQKSQVEKMMGKISKFSTHIDVLVNNAGIALQKLFCDTQENEWDALFDVNVKGIYHCCKSVLPGMIKNKNGNIINISSIFGICGASCEVAYSASKSAVIGFTKALAKEVGPCNINVNCIAPGVIDTEMNKNLKQDILKNLKEETPLRTIGQASDIAKVIFFFASDDAKFITGQVISPNGGLVM